MPSLGPLEILVVLVVALLVFGPNKLPDISRQIGRAMREFRRVQSEFEDHVRTAFDDGEPSIAPGLPPMAPMPDPPAVAEPPSTSLIQPGAVPPADPAPNSGHGPPDPGNSDPTGS